MTGVIAQLEAATHRVVDHLSTALRAHGLTPGEVYALAHSVAELQGVTGQRPSTLTGVIDRLERRGLARRAVNARDRRSFVLELTPEGVEAAKTVEEAFAAVEARAGLDERDVAAFHRVLRALEDAAA